MSLPEKTALGVPIFAPGPPILILGSLLLRGLGTGETSAFLLLNGALLLEDCAAVVTLMGRDGLWDESVSRGGGRFLRGDVGGGF